MSKQLIPLADVLDLIDRFFTNDGKYWERDMNLGDFENLKEKIKQLAQNNSYSCSDDRTLIKQTFK